MHTFTSARSAPGEPDWKGIDEAGFQAGCFWDPTGMHSEAGHCWGPPYSPSSIPIVFRFCLFIVFQISWKFYIRTI